MAKGSTLGKDPGVTWMFNDWHGGTMVMSRHQKGAYMDLLTAQFNNGHLSIDAIKNVLGNDFAAWQGVLSKKFICDAQGLYYNERLELEILKRKSYNESRRLNAKGSNAEKHMGIGNGLLDLDLKRKEFEEKVNSFIQYPEKMRLDFIDYWTEHNENGVKMLYEMKKTFDVSKRLARWSNNNFKTGSSKSEFPNEFDRKFYFDLQSNDQPRLYKYQEHLRSLGLVPQYNTTDSPMKGTLIGWVKKKEAA